MKNALTFADALKSSRPVAFSTMVKPVGAACNLRCTYCYYLDKELQYQAKPKLMSDELLEEYVAQYIEANDTPRVDFCWHGGEPLMAGMDFYRKALAFQNRYKGTKEIGNTLQTNGLLLTDDFCKFFADNNFLIGISIDGPESVHNATRFTASGEGTFARVMQAIERMHRHKTEFNTLSAVSRYSQGRGAEIYRFMKAIGSRYMQFLPVVEYQKDGVICPPEADGTLAEWSVTARGYGRFLKDVFEEWVVGDVGLYYVQMFDATLAGWYGVPAGVCSFNEVCGDGLVVEHNGDVYSCDHFVYPDHRLGNILRDDLRGMFTGSRQFSFGVNKRNTLPQSCEQCEWLTLCHGECPKHRFEDGKNALCEGFASYFKYTKPYMEFMKKCLDEQKPPSMVTEFARHRMGLI
ncbi:Putative arylsulfatase regulatory protein [Mucinivorans hirudinis]|uniref:Putative arylsulfatase regulatory protein n=1 Tax=Mucinivorans hirudinis TaxID=1433126 RepID=A0A060R7J8_9BACT|nr:Putative arylsulfatase regulatory protein [Mucinivorans hirudinis]